MEGLRLVEIWIYPIKSLGGIRLKSSKVFGKGLQYDRRWMLVDEAGNFMTQREHPKMALFKLTRIENGFDIRFNGNSITLKPGTLPAEPPMQANIWDDIVTVQEVDKAFSSWFSHGLGVLCKLVSFPEESARPVDPDYVIGNDQVSLADAYPFLIIGEQSLEDLNGRLKERLPMNRFRPNLVFRGGEAFEEDTWRNFSIGKNRFVGVKPCGRCAITTVNQETAEKGIEPLTTLSTYRKQNGKVCFGQNVIALDHDEIFEGDEIVLQ